MMNDREKILLSDLNLAEYEREMTRWNSSGEICEQDDLLLTKSSPPFPTTCVAMNLSDNKASARETFDRIRSFYREHRSPFSIQLRKHKDRDLEDICRAEKMLLISEAPGMVIDRPLPLAPLPEGLQIRYASDTAGLLDFTSVVRDSYQSLGMPASVATQIFASPERLVQPQLEWMIACHSGRPVSVAMSLFSHGVAGLYWVGTMQNERGKGYARACVRAITNAAFERHAALVVLQASKFGAPLYERMGFREITRYPWYMQMEP